MLPLFLWPLATEPALPEPDGGAKDLVRASDVVIAAAPTRWALLVGVDNYESEDIPDLRFTVNDAKTLAATLIQSGVFPPEQVIVMTPDQADPRLRPSRTNILNQLARLSSVANGADMVFFFFSGHGSAAGEGEHRQNYLYPIDTSIQVPTQTALELSTVLAMLGESHARQRVVILDACRNELPKGAKGAVPPAFADLKYALSEGTRVVFSTRFGDYSYEDEEAQLGAMTAHLVRGLTGPADGALGEPDGVVGLAEALQFTQEGLYNNPGPQGPQILYSTGEVAGADFAMVPTLVERDAQSELGPPQCPSSDLQVADQARYALHLYNAGDSMAFFGAHTRALMTLACTTDPVSLGTTLDLMRAEALWAQLVKDSGGAVAAASSVYTLAPDRPLWEGVTARNKAIEALEAEARALPPAPVQRLDSPRGTDLVVNGKSSPMLPQDRPAVVQVVNWDGSLQWSVVWHPGERLPELAPAPPRDLRKGLTLGFGGAAAATALASGGLGLGAFLSMRQAESLSQQAARDNLPLESEVEAAIQRNQTLARASMLGMGLTLTLGVGAVGARLWVPPVEER